MLVPGLLSLLPALHAALAWPRPQVLYGPRTGSRTADFAVRDPLPPGIPGLDATVPLVETLRPDTPRATDAGDHASIWLQRPQGTAEVVMGMADGALPLVRSEVVHDLVG